jgi:hypothetical protein
MKDLTPEELNDKIMKEFSAKWNELQTLTLNYVTSCNLGLSEQEYLSGRYQIYHKLKDFRDDLLLRGMKETDHNLRVNLEMVTKIISDFNEFIGVEHNQSKLRALRDAALAEGHLGRTYEDYGGSSHHDIYIDRNEAGRYHSDSHSDTHSDRDEDMGGVPVHLDFHGDTHSDHDDTPHTDHVDHVDNPHLDG